MSANDTGRVVIITGAAGGIGRVLVSAALDVGYRVALLDRDKGRLDQIISELKECNQGDELLACIVDVADEKSCTIAIEQVISQFGRLDGLVNAAGIGMVVVRDSHMVEPVRFDEVSSDHWNQFFDINAKGPFLMAKGALPYLVKGGWGRIVNITSGTVSLGSTNYLHYITSKFAMIGMTRSMARELGPWNITVNTFCPGIIKTEIPRPSAPDKVFEMFRKQQCLPRLTTIDDLAKPMLFLCSEEAKFMTGQIFEPDGGLSFN